MVLRSSTGIFFSPKELIINEGVNTPQMQSLIQMANKTMAGILTSKTQEDIKVLGLVCRRGRWDSFADYKSHQDLWTDYCKDLKGEERKLWRGCQYWRILWTVQSRTMEIKITFVYFKQSTARTIRERKRKTGREKSFMKNYITCLLEWILQYKNQYI